MFKIYFLELYNIFIVFLIEKVGGLIIIVGDCRCLYVIKIMFGFLFVGIEVKINKIEKIFCCFLFFGIFDVLVKCLF